MAIIIAGPLLSFVNLRSLFVSSWCMVRASHRRTKPKGVSHYDAPLSQAPEKIAHDFSRHIDTLILSYFLGSITDNLAEAIQVFKHTRVYKTDKYGYVNTAIGLVSTLICV